MKVISLTALVLFLSIVEILAQGPTVITTTNGSIGSTSVYMPSISTTRDPDEITVSTENTSTTESTTTTPPPPRGPCDGRIGEILPDYPNCGRFMVCSPQSEPIYFYCPPNYIFKAGQNRCVVGNQETCQTTPYAELCLNTFFGAFPHPEEPDRYVACVLGRPGNSSCPTGQTFEALLAKCVNII